MAILAYLPPKTAFEGVHGTLAPDAPEPLSPLPAPPRPTYEGDDYPTEPIKGLPFSAQEHERWLEEEQRQAEAEKAAEKLRLEQEDEARTKILDPEDAEAIDDLAEEQADYNRWQEIRNDIRQQRLANRRARIDKFAFNMLIPLYGGLVWSGAAVMDDEAKAVNATPEQRAEYSATVKPNPPEGLISFIGSLTAEQKMSTDSRIHDSILALSASFRIDPTNPYATRPETAAMCKNMPRELQPYPVDDKGNVVDAQGLITIGATIQHENAKSYLQIKHTTENQVVEMYVDRREANGPSKSFSYLEVKKVNGGYEIIGLNRQNPAKPFEFSTNFRDGTKLPPDETELQELFSQVGGYITAIGAPMPVKK